MSWRAGDKASTSAERQGQFWERKGSELGEGRAEGYTTQDVSCLQGALRPSFSDAFAQSLFLWWLSSQLLGGS